MKKFHVPDEVFEIFGQEDDALKEMPVMVTKQTVDQFGLLVGGLPALVDAINHVCDELDQLKKYGKTDFDINKSVMITMRDETTGMKMPVPIKVWAQHLKDIAGFGSYLISRDFDNTSQLFDIEIDDSILELAKGSK
ncbi:hypothetical protein ACFBZI_11035 [Moraxella sp. ZJ142]|uniref:hypothetical protein n=1 Tax=Moraxella marmotae TaxID=3344520 RepID=UPI0035D43554